VTPEDVLARAADIVERGWRQDASTDGDHRRCLTMALNDATPEYAPYRAALDAVAREIGIEGSNVCMVGQWNDAPGRTQEEVVTALRNAKRWL
jgi:hypothetical protein